VRGGESGAGPTAPEPLGSDGKPAKKKGNGLAKALLVFHEVSNDCEDEFAVRGAPTPHTHPLCVPRYPCGAHSLCGLRPGEPP
jgi:hypothetical protein